MKPEPEPESVPSRRPLVALTLLALIVSGASQAVISPPLNWWWLHPVSFVPALWALSRLQGGRAVLAGWLIGITANMTIFYWVFHTARTFSNLPDVVALACLLGFSLFWGFYAGIFAWGFAAIRRRSGDWWPLAIAAWFVACEYLNPQLFPFYQGVAWYQLPRVFLVTALAGVPFVTFCVLLVNAVIFQGLERRRDGVERPFGGPVLRNGAILAGLVLFSLVFSSVRLGKIEQVEAEADTVRIALVQTNRDVFELRAMAQRSRFASINDLVDLSLDAWDDDGAIDVFVWPEGALRGAPGSRRNRRARDLVKDTGAELWTGGSYSLRGDDGDVVHHNSAYRVHGPKAKVDPRYDKNILLPFGEFMPLKETLPFLKKIKGVGNYNAGDGLTVQQSEHASFVFLICYEAIRHRYVRGGVSEGADLLVNITYDAWFGDTSNPTQHLMLSAIQSAQYGVPLVRAATTGISAHVDARGVLVEQTPVFERRVLISDVKKVRVPSPYTVLGDWFAWLCIAAAALLLVLGQDPQDRWSRRHWIAWGVIAFATLAVPKLAWLANPYLPLGDWIAWALACASLVAVGVLAWRRRAAGESP
jgi:apolipoprotein N-acyltransferase